MCGSGQTTRYVLSRGAVVGGLDISENEIESFRAHFPDCTGIAASVLDSGLESGSFDCVCVESGLHHLHPHVDRGIDELHRVLKPGGMFCFAEPHAGSLPDRIRRAWYARDALFADNEASIDLDADPDRAGFEFEFIREDYHGNIAYLLILQSMILRIPVALKRYYARPLLALEALIEPLQGRRLSCGVTGQWRKVC
jgi:SAM-dependent methyltransferase